MTPLVIGLDPSLTSFGWSDGTHHATRKTIAGEGLRERCRQIFVWLVEMTERRRAAGDHVLWVIEAPILLARPSDKFTNAMTNLFDRGYLSAAMDDAADAVDADVIEVPVQTLRKFVGKGNIPKAQLPIAVYKRWHIEFADDRGSDKCFAYCLHKYGLAYLAGELSHKPAAARGVKHRKIA